jgi:signal transduction histidine kinase
MRIKTRLALSIWISLAAVAGMLAAIAWSYRSYQTAERNDLLTDRIRRANSTMISLRDEYLMHHEERSRKQFLLRQAELVSLLGQAAEQLSGLPDQALLSELAGLMETTNELFTAIVATAENHPAGADAALRVQDYSRRLASQLIITSYRRSEAIDRLREANRAQRNRSFRNTVLLVTLCVAGGSGVIVFNSIFTNKLVGTRIRFLEAGAKAFAAGDLTRRIAVAGDDELAELSRAFDLMAEKLQRSYRSLEAANKELEGFSYSVSHDLRAPLRHINAFIELLVKRSPTVLDDKTRHYLDVISSSAKQMGKLIDDLLSFSRMGRAEMKQTRVNLDALLAEVVEAVRSEMAERQILWVANPLPEVTGDPAMLKIALYNLVHNAAKYSANKPAARIEIGQIPGSAEVTIFVKDNGAGFDMKYVDKLFGLFQRLHTTDEFPGTGLGLANVRRIIHRHGGRTWAEGAVDEGATFFFTLPPQQEG